MGRGVPHSPSFSITSYDDCILGNLLTFNTSRPAASARRERLLSPVFVDGNFPAGVSSTVPANVIAPSHRDWVTMNCCKNYTGSLCKLEMLKAGWKTRKIPFIYSASASLVSNSTIQGLAETSAPHENTDNAFSVAGLFP